MTDDEIRDIFGEIRRIGVDLGTPPGLALGTGFPEEGSFLLWLRTLPDNLGHEAFVELLNSAITAATPNVVVDDGTPVPTPRRYAPTVEQLHATIDLLVHEWDPLGARLGTLDRDDVAVPAYNAINAILHSGPTRDVEAQIAANLHRVEREVFGLRASPLIQTRYIVRRIMQVVADHPGPAHQFDPVERLQQEAEAAREAETPASGFVSAPSRRNTVRLGPGGDEPPALDPKAKCDECGATGTVAYVTRDLHPRLSRYCARCWRQVRHKYWGLPESIDKDTPEGMIAAFDRFYEYVRERPATADSALWEDKLVFLHDSLQPRDDESPSDRERQLRQIARELLALAPRMYGPMPPEVEAFVQRHATTDA